MRELKKNKGEVKRLLESAKDDLIKEKENFSKCKDLDLQKCYAESIKRYEKIIKGLEEELEKFL